MRLKIFYLLFLSIVIFSFNNPYLIFTLLFLQVLFLIWIQKSFFVIYRSFRRPFFYILFVAITLIIFPEDCVSTYYTYNLYSIEFKICKESILYAVLMSARIYTIILASQITQHSESGEDFISTLKKLRVSETIVLTIDATFAFLEPTQKKEDYNKTSIRFRDILKGNLNFIQTVLVNYIKWSENFLISKKINLSDKKLADISLIAGLTILSAVTRFLHIFPGLPFAPGHKGIIIIPLYIIASQLVTSGYGGTKLGASAGVISFFTGQDRFGVFEIFKHIIPGVFSDFIQTILNKRKILLPVHFYSILGIVLAATRFSTIFVITLLMNPPKIVFAFITPALLSQCIFGGISGFVSFFLIKSLMHKAKEEDRHG